MSKTSRSNGLIPSGWKETSALVARTLLRLGFATAALLSVAVLALSLTITAHPETANSPASFGLDTGQALSLAEAKRMAFIHNWDLLAAKSDVDIALAQRIVAREFPNPTLSLSSSLINVDSHPSSTAAGNGIWDRSYDSIAAINQLFEIGGKRRYRKGSAEAGANAAEARLLDARRLLDQAVTQAYIAALLGEANVQILKQSAESLRRESGIAQQRLKVGDISLADESQIEIAAERLELDASKAESDAKAGKIALEVLLGAKDPKGDWRPSDSLEALADSNLMMLAGQAIGSNRPDLVAAEAEEQKAESDLRFQKAMRIPDPTFLVQYEHQPPDNFNSIGLGLSFPVPLWNHNRGAINAARAAQEQASARLEKIKVEIAGEMVRARLAYHSAISRYGKQREEIQPKSAKIRETVSFAYEKGGASLLDLLSAERNDNDVRLATAQAAADAANAAADLKAALNLKEAKK